MVTLTKVVLHLLHSNARRVMNGLEVLTLVTVPMMLTNLSYILALSSFIFVSGRKLRTLTFIKGIDFVLKIDGIPAVSISSDNVMFDEKLDAVLSFADVLFICLAFNFSMSRLYLSMINLKINSM